MHIYAKLWQEKLLRMVRWLRWHCPPDTGFEIRALAVWGRARYLSVTEAPHNTDFHTWMGKKHFCFFQTAETGNRTPNPGVKGSGANHYPRAPALGIVKLVSQRFCHCKWEKNIIKHVSRVRVKGVRLHNESIVGLLRLFITLSVPEMWWRTKYNNKHNSDVRLV